MMITAAAIRARSRELSAMALPNIGAPAGSCVRAPQPTGRPTSSHVADGLATACFAMVRAAREPGGHIMLTRREFAQAAAATVLAQPACAQAAWPSRPIHILVGYPAGGGVDLVARLLGEPLKANLGQTVIVENRPGASAMIAAQAVATAAPDGYTLLAAAAGEIATNQFLFKDKMSYDPQRQLAPVALAGIVPCVVVVAATTPVHT